MPIKRVLVAVLTSLVSLSSLVTLALVYSLKTSADREVQRNSACELLLIMHGEHAWGLVYPSEDERHMIAATNMNTISEAMKRMDCSF